MSAPPATEPARRDDRRFGPILARQLLMPRFMGLLLCAVCVVVTVVTQAPQPPLWVGVGIGLNLLVWPVIAWWRVRRAADGARAERLNLGIDATLSGFWVAALQGALVPSAALLLTTSLTNAVMGGPRAMALAWLGQALGWAVGTQVWGWRLQPDSGTAAVLGALPLLLIFPLLMANFMHHTNRRLNQKRRQLRFLSEHDALSGVHNRRYFDQTLHQVFSQFRRRERTLSLLVGDVDNFKHINDTQGHAAGDEVIRRFGKALSASARAGDVVARLGGDEFVVLLFDTNAEQAFHFARRVQQQMGDVSVSFGVAMARPTLKNHEHWLEQADKALYRSKAHDRGGVSLAGTDGAPPAAAG